jgi:hypothetical protein
VDETSWDAVAIHPEDDVAVALRPLSTGEVRVRRGGDLLRVRLRDDIGLGHKFALHDLPAGAVVRKYGEPIGSAIVAIARGAHVHVHNLRSRRARSGADRAPANRPA